MSKIQVLHPHIANQIAAGEVVERPASVVKELVENALDAGATSITVEIANGGLSSIRVCDNGRGIPAQECVLAFERHATSKIHNQEDLTHIDTLGFRGEALASIAAVAHVEMKSRFLDAPIGMRIRIEGGERKLVKPVASTQGTTIVVDNLFYNVPARRKFLKSPNSEASYIGDYVSRMVLARPDVSFRYISQQKTVYHSQGDGELKNAIYCVYGGEQIGNLIALSHDEGYLCIKGYIGSPEISRPNRTQQSFFLNGRYIRSAQISNALMQAYDTLLMGKRYPFAVINIGISSREVDVNVHPTKLEVRFAQEGRVMNVITRICSDALLKTRRITAISLDKAGDEAREDTLAPVYTQGGEVTQKDDASPLRFDTLSDAQTLSIKLKECEFHIPQYKVTAPLSDKTQALHADELDKSPKRDDIDVTNNTNEGCEAYASQQSLDKADVKDLEPAATQQDFGKGPMAVIGQAFDTYWIVQQDEALYIIDQHAAHERILYERLMKEAERPASQSLLTPELLRLSALESGLLYAHTDELEALGFDIMPFDAVTARVDAIPAVLTGGNIGQMLRDALELIRLQGRASTKQLRREAIIQASCKHAVRAGDALTKEELEWILNFFISSNTPFHCPHGRPIVVKLEKREIEKLFKRLI